MKLFNNKLAVLTIALGTSLLSLSTLAAVTPGTASVTTIGDINVTQESIINFGGNILPVAGTKCTMENTLAPNTADTAIESTWAWTTTGGAGCGTDTGISGGVFSISGADSQAVKITLTKPTDETSVIFVPSVIYSPVPFAKLTESGLTTGGAVAVAITNLNRQSLGDAALESNVTLDSDGEGSLLIGGSLEVVNLAAGLIGQEVTYTVNVVY